MILRIILGLIGTGIGFLFVQKSEWLLSNVGGIGPAEKYLGGSRMGYKLIGILIIVIAFLYISGLPEGVLKVILGPLFGIGGFGGNEQTGNF